MKKIFTFLSVLSLAGFSFGQISLTALNTAYTQNFDGLASSGTTGSTMPTNWVFSETGSNANATYSIDDGTSNSGNTYSYGTVGSLDRALGSIRSGSLVAVYGANFVNNTSQVIKELQVDYTGEQWRLGATGRADKLVFEYSTNATSLSTGTWFAVTQLDYTSTSTAGTVGKTDGNNASYRTDISYAISGLNIISGQTFWIRFTDSDASGADDGLAVDDFSIVPQNSTLSVGDVAKTKNIFLKNTLVDNTLSFQAKGNASVKVYNVSGQLVKSAIITSTNSDLDVSSLSKGNYVVTAELNGEKISQKVIKK